MRNENVHATPDVPEGSDERSNLEQLNNWQNVESLKDDFDPEAAEKAKKEREELIQGSKTLAKVGFEQSHRNIVESSFQKVRQKKEKLPGRNSERRDLAYLMRLKNMIETGNERTEPRLWRLSADKLVIDEENIPESYFKTQEQIMRDAGQGHELTDYERETISKDAREKQRQSLTEWSNYFSDEDNPYPLWFKVYAWDGMSKMGVFDKEHQKYAKRDETTVAPYPGLNQAALAKTYEAIISGQSGEAPENNEELASLVKASNFAPLYTHFLLEQKSVIPTPEKTEDVHGEWVEYLPGQEKELSVAAEGTPWCVASPAIGKNYLENGGYAPIESYRAQDNKAKFILFHLEDPSSGELSEGACASIRLDAQGKVAEISGLQEGQALEDSLVPIVEKKCLEFPGGENYLAAFEDKKRLIGIDHKLQNNEPLSEDELKFIYEIERPINKLDSYNDDDPRVVEARQKYGVQYVLDLGFPAEKVAKSLSSEELLHNFDTFMDMGVSADEIANNLSDYFRLDKSADAAFSRLLHHCSNPQILVDKIKDDEDALFRHHKELKSLGININPKKYLDALSFGTVADNFDEIASLGASYETLAGGVLGDKTEENLNKLLARNISIHKLIEHIPEATVDEHFDVLLSAGATKEEIAQNLSGFSEERSRKALERLISLGMKIDEIVDNMSNHATSNNLSILIELGADPNRLGRAVTSVEDIDQLVSLGANIDTIISGLSKTRAFMFLRPSDLISRGADINQLGCVIGNADDLDDVILEGANVNSLIKDMSEMTVLRLFDDLLERGADPKVISSRLGRREFRYHLRHLRRAQRVARRS